MERSVSRRVWMAAALFVCLVSAAGIVAILRAVPASYASSITDERAQSSHDGSPGESSGANARDPPTPVAAVPGTIKRGNRPWCPECGVVESMRTIAGSAEDGGQGGTDDGKVAGVASRGASRSAIDANALTGRRYEITVRFRDGSTTIFNEATPRTWRLGGRVMVIGGAKAPND